MANYVQSQAVSRLFDRVPIDAAAKADLVARMTTPDRFYHGLDHLALLWDRHCAYAGQTGFDEMDRLIACAIAFHDCVYDSRREDNEERSAEVWMNASRQSGLSGADRLWVAETICATRDHLTYLQTAAIDRAPPRNAGGCLRKRARSWMLDLDLTPLGETPAEFDRNTQMLRREYLHLSERQWQEGQIDFLRRFFEAPRIYASPTLEAVFEAPARRNLEQQLAFFRRSQNDQAAVKN
jgi:predicted metal-dependent HD superfamily phosphohydrolase